MQPPFGFELDWIAAFQGTGAWQRVMRGASWLGSEACVAVLPCVYMGLSRSAGLRLFLLLTSANVLQYLGKLAFHAPRPFWIDPRIRPLGEAGGFGLPSGHVLNASIVWPYTVRATHLPVGWMAVAMILLLVGASRLYLGVHSLTDVVCGCALGLGWVGAFVVGERLWGDRIGAWSAARQTLLLLAMAAALGFLGWAAWSAAAAAVPPPAAATWFAKASRPDGICRALGMWVGAAGGAIGAQRWARFEVGGPYWRRGLAIFLTLGAGGLAHWLAKRAPEIANPSLSAPLNFAYGAAFYGWLVWGAPWLLLKAGLLSTSAVPTAASSPSGPPPPRA